MLVKHQLKDQLLLNNFQQDQYDLTVAAANGFFRRFKGDKEDPDLSLACGYEAAGLVTKKLTGNIELLLENNGDREIKLKVTDNAYKQSEQQIALKPGGKAKITMNLKNSSCWYDFTVVVLNHSQFSRQYAGHVETGEDSITDPLMAGLM